LHLNSSGTISSELGWSGSGGGISSVENQPNYQNGAVTQSSNRRTNPDVAYDADPATGFSIDDSYNNSASAPWTVVGGTSDAAPQWAALIAIADQGRAEINLGPSAAAISSCRCCTGCPRSITTTSPPAPAPVPPTNPPGPATTW
jgi:subtilase family serine protease